MARCYLRLPSSFLEDPVRQRGDLVVQPDGPDAAALLRVQDRVLQGDQHEEREPHLIYNHNVVLLS